MHQDKPPENSLESLSDESLYVRKASHWHGNWDRNLQIAIVSQLAI